jgi:hypothetical protein
MDSEQREYAAALLDRAGRAARAAEQTAAAMNKFLTMQVQLENALSALNRSLESRDKGLSRPVDPPSQSRSQRPALRQASAASSRPAA